MQSPSSTRAAQFLPISTSVGGRNQRSVVLHQIVELVEAEKVTIGEGHIGIHHAYHQVGALHCGNGAVDRSPQRHPPLLVRQGNLHQGGTQRNLPAAIKLLALAQMHGQIVGIAGIHVGTHVGAKEEALVEEDALVAGLAVRSRAFSVEVMEMQVPHIPGISPAAERAYQAVRHARHAAEMYMAAGRNMAHGLICGDVFNCFH